jgi:hypothetical protein
MDVWRIECPHGLGHEATITLNGTALTNAHSVTIELGAGGIATATFKVENVEVDIGLPRWSAEGFVQT